MIKFQVNAETNRYCPTCVPIRKLIVKENRHTGHQFLGCPNWPECEHTEPIPDDMIMIATGASRLPGF